MFWEQVGVFATTVGAFGFIGRAIDVYIGKDGQNRIYRTLEHYWLVFSDVKLRNVGRSEAKFASQLISKCYISRYPIVALVFYLIWLSAPIYSYSVMKIYGGSDLFGLELAKAFVGGFAGAVTFLLSFYIVYLFAVASSKLLTDSTLLNLLYFVVLYLFQMFMLNAGSVIISSALHSMAEMVTIVVRNLRFGANFDLWPVFNSIISLLIENVKALVFNPRIFYTFSIFQIHAFDFVSVHMLFFHLILGIVVNSLRLFIVVLFIILIVARPIHHVIAVYWLRLTQERVPFFTFLFMAVVAVLNFFAQVPKLLGALLPLG